MAAEWEETTMADLVRELLDHALVHREQEHTNQTYRALQKVRGICKDNISKTMQTVDDVLYSEKGAWQGDYAK